MKKLSVPVATAIASLALAASASAVSSSVTIEPFFKGSGGFEGEVDSPNSNCIEERKVVVFRKRPGKDPRKIGADRSDATGAWSIIYTLRDGRYFARVKPKEIGNRTCKGARSGTLSIKN